MITCTLTYFNYDLYDRLLAEAGMAKKEPTYTDNEQTYGHPSEDRTTRFSKDALLRVRGFKIHSRRKGKEAVWERAGKLYTFSEALRSLNRDDVDDAEYAEVMEEDDE